MRIPVYKEGIPEPVGYQIRRPGKPPLFDPRGIKVSECLPHIGRILHNGAPLLICEGPTDCIAAMDIPALCSHSIIGCWSSSTIPDRDFWEVRCHGRTGPVVACGDNDDAGKAFNQRIADAVGSCYAIRWPIWFHNKGDVKDYLEIKGSDAFKALLDISLYYQPLVRLEKQKTKSKRTYASSPVLVSTIIEAAGGRLAFTMAEDRLKYYCPLHEDKEDASLTVDDATGSWHCWAEGIGGGPAQFLMAWKGVDYKSAMELLKLYA